MSSWPRIKDLFHAALEREPAERAAFLNASCGDEAGVRAEVERLLAAHEHAGRFIEQSPISMAGRVVGHYQIERLIGAGGMGEVYLARDLELGRTVAVKIALGSDTDLQARLRSEAQHASRLNHPNICTIHEVGASDGYPFIVMEFVEGKRLADVIPQGGLTVDQVVRFGEQMAAALEHAHQNGVIHRDLKSANVMVTADGRIKVLDFGLARRHSAERLKDLSESHESLTPYGAVAGTLSSMAPELLRGGLADARSDIWALGVLLYEMATGKLPFACATGFELSGAILHEPPAPLPDSIPAFIRNIITRCLEKNPSTRYQDAGDVRSALEGAATRAPVDLAQPSTVAAASPSFLMRGWQRRIAWTVAIVLAILVFVSYRVLRRDDAPVAVGASGRPAIAVLHFENAGGQDVQWLSQGIPSMLLTGLAQMRGLDIVSMQRLRDAAKQHGTPDLASLDQSLAGEIAKQAGAGAIVTGSIYKAGAEIRIDARVEDLASGRVLAADTVQGTNVFAMVDRLTARIRAGIGIEEVSSVRGVADVSTTSLDAYRAFAEGVEARHNFRFEEAQKFLDRAVSIDPRFADAHLELALVAQGLGRQDLRVEHLGKAAEYSDRLSERERLLLDVESARVRENFAEAARALDDLTAKFPDVEAAYDIAVQLYHPVFGALPSVEKSLAFGKAGVTALPFSTVARQTYAFALYSVGRNVDALREFETYARIAPREPEPHIGMGYTYQVMGLPEKAIEAFDRALKIQPDLVSARDHRAFTFAMMGRFDEALADDPPTLPPKARYLSRVGRYREAAQLLASVTKDQLNSVLTPELTHIVGAMLATERKDYARALRECDAADRIIPERLPAEWRHWRLLSVATIRGVVEARNGRIAQAISQLGVVRRLHEPTWPMDNYFYRVLDGEIALAGGDLGKAAEAFTSAEPGPRAQFGYGYASPPFRDGLARVAVARNDRKAAIEIYRRLLAPGAEQKFLAVFEPLYVLEIARLLDQLGDNAAALKEYERFLGLWKRADPDLPELDEARRAVARLSRSG